MSSKNNLPPPEERFYANTIKMTNLIRDIVVKANKAGYNDVTPFVVDLASKYLKNNYDKRSLIEGFIQQSHPPNASGDGLDHTLWDKILKKDEEFFREKAFDIFKNLPSDAVDAFKKLSTYQDPKTKEDIISKEEKEEIISYFHAFVKISIKYIHAMRQPYIVTSSSPNDERKYRYKNSNFMKGIDVLAHAKAWDIKLEFAK